MFNEFNYFRLFSVIERLASRGWRGTLESVRRLLGLFSKLLLTVRGRLTTGDALAVLAMAREIIRIYRKSGPLFLGMYLKQVSFLLMWYVGGDAAIRPAMKIFVSVTRSGLPRFIPPEYRKRLLQKKDPLVIQIVLSICTLSKLLMVPPRGGPRVRPTTIHVRGFSPSEACMNLCRELVSVGASVIQAYSPEAESIPLTLGFRIPPSFSSGPNTYKKALVESLVSKEVAARCSKLTIYHSLPVDATAVMTLFRPEQLFVLGSVWFSNWTLYGSFSVEDPYVPRRQGAVAFERMLSLCFPPAEKLWWPKMVTRPEAGRFGRKLEGSGKLRIFAIGCPIFQGMLRPLHDWCMSVLKTLVCDGTFDQLAPLERLRGIRDLYCFDLKSATDLLPSVLSGSLLTGLFGDHLATSWHWLMSMVGFRSPDRMSNPLRANVYRFTRGQPLGYYSSWPVFTLTHHVLVWLAAHSVYPGRKFRDYAILGDDLVIGDSAVAGAYVEIMDRAMGVISLEKSLVSHNGTCEFAKRFIVLNHSSERMDLSPKSMRLLRSLSGYTTPHVFVKLGASFRTSFRLRGAGYRVASSLREPYDLRSFVRLSRRWRRHWLLQFTPGGLHPLPIEIWLTLPFGRVLTCYQYGMVRAFIMSAVRPKDLQETSFDDLRAFWTDCPLDTFVEWTISPIVSLHLAYLKWYSTRIPYTDHPLSDLLSPPVSPRAVRREKERSVALKYGLLFRVWDFVRAAVPPAALAHDPGMFRRHCVLMTDPSFIRPVYADVSLISLECLSD